ncbi:unnamed protein product [Discula destructiva]
MRGVRASASASAILEVAYTRLGRT